MEPEHERVDVEEAPRKRLDGVRVHVRPLGDTEYVRPTVPVKLFVGAMVIVELAEAPATADTLVGLAEMVKSVT